MSLYYGWNLFRAETLVSVLVEEGARPVSFYTRLRFRGHVVMSLLSLSYARAQWVGFSSS